MHGVTAGRKMGLNRPGLNDGGRVGSCAQERSGAIGGGCPRRSANDGGYPAIGADDSYRLGSWLCLRLGQPGERDAARFRFGTPGNRGGAPARGPSVQSTPRSPSWLTIANSLSGSTRQLWQTAFALSSHASQPPSSGGSATRPAEPLIQFRSTSPEGCGLNADRQLARHLTIALGSANELQDIVDAFERRGRLDPSDLDLPAEISRIRAMLAGLHK